MNNFSTTTITPTILANCFLFNGLDEDGLTAVCQLAKIRKVNTGEFFFHEGEPAESFFILRSGMVRLLQTTAEGKQVIMNLCGPGDGMSIVVALEEDAVTPVSAEAIKEASAYVWDKATIRQLMEMYSIVAINGMRMLADRLQRVQNHYCELATERVEQRVARTLLRLAEQGGVETDTGIKIDMPLTRQDIAQMTGTTLYTVSRILSKWEQIGLVNTGRGKVEIALLQKMEFVAESIEDDSAQGT